MLAVAVSRELERFPTRNYPYRIADGAAASPPEVEPATPARPNVLFRRVLGIDPAARPMTADELLGLDDPFGHLLRSGKPFPLTLRELLVAVDDLGGTRQALPDQLVFLAADGGHIPWTPETDRLRRSFRFVVARGRGEFNLLVSSSTALDSPVDNAFLQVAGWDATHQVFHYYERRQGTYFWAGMSHHALEDATRGRGPFDSHVNGSLVMKELRSPWMHWHAPLAGINEEALAPDDPLRNDPLFRKRATAERLEIEVVRPAIRRWNEARVRGALDAGGAWRYPRHFLRQALTDTAVNLASSETASHLLTDATPVRPPLSFFLNRDTLFDTLALEPQDVGVADIAVPGSLYRRCLQRYDVHRSDGAIRIEGDSLFAFLTPEPAYEDTQLVDTMVREGLLSPRFVACLSMVDFTNPVFSERRAALVSYAPPDGSGIRSGDELEARFVATVGKAVASDEHGAGRADSPEREFLANWQIADHKRVFIGRITDYFKALRSGMVDADVVDGWFRLAEYRRRCFRKRPLAEFALSTPRTNIPLSAPALRMTLQGRAEPIIQSTSGHSPPAIEPKRRIVVQRLDPPGHLDDFTEAEKDAWSRTVSG